MKLQAIDTGFFKLDGGAMFGIIPKVLWQKSAPADTNNLCTWAMRCLLIEEGDRLILVDTGIGEKQSDKFFKHYYLHGEDTLLNSIKKAGYSPDEVTDVILTHLHFDHCGGAVRLENGKSTLNFKNAKYWSNEAHWNWAINPNPREKASFLRDNMLPIQESGQLHFIEENGNFLDGKIKMLFADGHTEKQMLPMIEYQGKTLIYAADLLPSAAHIPLPYVMGYDTRPLLTLAEKEIFLKNAATQQHIIMLEHDPKNECCSLEMTEKGVRLKDTFKLQEVFS